MGIYILIFELFIIIFYGIFVRTGIDTVSTFTDIQSPIYFTLAFTLLHFKARMYDWSQLTNFVFIAAIVFQIHTLYWMFWQSAFYREFYSTKNLTSFHLIINVECTLAILVTVFQFVGRFTTPQIFAITMVEVFAFALNFSINQLGTKTITAGGTMTIFLFGYLFALPIKKLCCEQELQNADDEKQRYFTLTLKFIGLVVSIMLWPSFCYSTALVDEYYLIISMGHLLPTANLSAEAFLQMIIGFFAAIGTTLGLRVMGQKIVLDKFINTLLMTGIFLSSSASVIIDPFASILMGAFAPILVYLIEQFLPAILVKGYPTEGIIFATLGGIFDSIFTAGRNSRTPLLSNQTGKQGGYQFLCLLITAVMALLFGALTALILRCFNPIQSINKDGTFWFIDQENLPIYPDDPLLRKINGENNKAMRQEGPSFNLKSNYLAEKQDSGKVIRQIIEGSKIN